MSTQPLFGGALSCAIPQGFTDVSSFRQVPDNQEVFANAQTDQCVIVELLQYESTVSNGESGSFFFKEIASSNGCDPDEVAPVYREVLVNGSANAPRIGREHAVSVFIGDQRVAKFKESDAAKNIVRVCVGNIRLPSVETDVVISVSVPLQISNASSSRDAVSSDNNADMATEILKQAIASFSVHDWDLFQ